MIEHKHPAVSRAIMLALLCYPIVSLTVRGGMNAMFLLLLIGSLSLIYMTRNTASFKQWDKYSVAFALAMASPTVAIFLSQAAHGEFKAPPYDGAARFLLAIPIYIALRSMNLRLIAALQYSLPLGALAALFSLLLNPYVWADHRATTGQFINLIHFADSALMLGLLSLFSINWLKRDAPLVLLLKISGFCAGLYLSIQSGERGGWIAVPPLLLIWAISRSKERFWARLGLAALLTGLAIWLGYLAIDVMRGRTDAVFQELADFRNGNKDTSIGIRLQLWQAAWHLFAEHPVFGIGPDNFARMMPSLSASGMLTPLAAELGGAEVHNEILSKTVGLGIFGLLSALSVHIVPLFILLRSARSAVPHIRASAFMGICVALGFLVFGLTVEIFDLKMTAAFYGVTIAVLLAAATPKTPSY